MDMKRKFSLRAARVQAGLGKDEVAEELGVSTSSLWRWETGRICPPASMAMKMCELYGLSFDEIDWTKGER